MAYAGLELDFFPRRNEEAALHRNDDAGAVVENGTDNSLPTQWQEQAEMLDDSVAEAAEETQLMLTDPLAFERHMVAKDIERNRVINA